MLVIERKECYIFAEVPSVSWVSPIAGMEYGMEQLAIRKFCEAGQSACVVDKQISAESRAEIWDKPSAITTRPPSLVPRLLLMDATCVGLGASHCIKFVIFIVNFPPSIAMLKNNST